MMRYVSLCALILMLIGGLQLDLVGFFGFSLFGWIFGSMSILTRILYALIGCAALYEMLHIVWQPRMHCVGVHEKKVVPTTI